MIVEIINWTDLKAQFGLEDNANGILSARQLSKELTSRANAAAANEHFAIGCSCKGEAVALFELSYKEKNTLYYEYTGTAN